MLKTIEQERAESEATVKGMDFIVSVRRLEQSGYIMLSPDDWDMDTTETLYKSKNAYYMRVELYHDFISSDDVYKVSRKEAEQWMRENVRNVFVSRQRKRMVWRARGKCYA